MGKLRQLHPQPANAQATGSHRREETQTMTDTTEYETITADQVQEGDTVRRTPPIQPATRRRQQNMRGHR